MTTSKLLAIGAAHLDRRGRVSGRYIPAASNPGTMAEEVGGGAFNALRNAVRHGAAGTIISLRGGDIAADAVAHAIAQRGIEDRSVVFLDRTTPSYTALLDEHGELIAGFADMGLYDTCFARQIRRRAVREAIQAADAILCDANMPADAVGALVDHAAGKPVHAIAISPAKVVRLTSHLSNLSCLFLNLAEARALVQAASDAPATEIASALRGRGLPSAVITEGAASLTAFDEAGIFTVTPPLASSIADVTGAGDALTGATVARLMEGMPLQEAVRCGVAASFLTIQTNAVVADYDDNAFAAALSLVGRPADVA